MQSAISLAAGQPGDGRQPRVHDRAVQLKRDESTAVLECLSRHVSTPQNHARWGYQPARRRGYRVAIRRDNLALSGVTERSTSPATQVVHVHDPKTGQGSANFDEYNYFIGRLRQAVPKMILQVGGSICFAPTSRASSALVTSPRTRGGPTSHSGPGGPAMPCEFRSVDRARRDVVPLMFAVLAYLHSRSTMREVRK